MTGLFGGGSVLIGRVGDPAIPGVVDFRCDRQSPLGNPFPISKEHGTRKEVCAKYDKWARQQMLEKGPYRKRIKKMRKLVQAGQTIRCLCHCSPKQCHTWTIRDLVLGR